jgi:hypothetical protein
MTDKALVEILQREPAVWSPHFIMPKAILQSAFPFVLLYSHWWKFRAAAEHIVRQRSRNDWYKFVEWNYGYL